MLLLALGALAVRRTCSSEIGATGADRGRMHGAGALVALLGVVAAAACMAGAVVKGRDAHSLAGALASVPS